jgi:hypothetical protein
MSLQHAAKHLAAHGRGKDTELIHMDKGEIASLQKIAMAHGGSLTINPHTGLPEAGFLSAIMPMVAGAGLMMIPGMQAYAAAGIVGGLKTMQSGSLKQGIMAGLGAYGGASMAGSFGAAGSGGSTMTLEGAAPPNPITPPAAPNGVIDVSGSSLSPASNLPPTPDGVTVGGQLPQNAGPITTQPIGPQVQDPGGLTMTNAQGVGPATNPSAGLTPKPEPFPGAGESYTVTPKTGFDTMSASERATAIRNGASFGNAADWAGANKYAAIGAAGSVAAGMKKDPLKPAEPDKDMGQRYSYSADKTNPLPAPDVPTYEDMLTKQGNYGRQQQYFSPSYTPISASSAKDLYHFAGGGPVELMSNQAAMGANTMYPMANMTTSAFATPYQDPRSTNMMSSMAPSGGGAVDAMSGEPNMQGTRMAEGGEAEGAVAESRPSYTYDAQTRKYTAGPSIGGISNAPQDFGASAGQAIDNFAADIARDGITTPMGGYIAPSSNGIPNYAYNPQTQQYVQMAGGGISGNVNFESPQSPNAGPLEQLIRMIHAKQNGSDPMEEAKKYEYNPDSQQYVQQQATGGLSDARYNLGGYSDGGRLLRGPGDGVSDSIPAVIGKKQPARLADGEFVVPARIVSELGNGSTEAGARKLYAMMDRIQASRKKTVGKNKVAHNNRADKYLPA